MDGQQEETMKKYVSILMVLCGFLIIASVSWATPVLNTAHDGIEDLSNGNVYATYQNSGTLLFINSGNANPSDPTAVQTALRSIAGYSNIVLTIAQEDVTGIGAASGTWTTSTDGTVISFYAVKAANAYALYLVDPADSSGSWSTYDLWKAGYGGNGALTISHIVGYNPSSVPEPSILILLGTGLIGILGVGRRK